MAFQPICGLCLSDCDRRGSVSSCSHFLCSRCLSRLPTAAPCPLCQRPCRMLGLDQPEAQPLLQSGSATLDQASRVVGTQLRHYQQINRRMRQALEMVHGQYQSLRRQRDEENAERTGALSKVRALEAECQRLQEQLSRCAARPPPSSQPQVEGSRASSLSSSHSPSHRPQTVYAHPHTPPHPPIAQRPTANFAGTPPAPLGWSTSSHIARRHHTDGRVGEGGASSTAVRSSREAAGRVTPSAPPYAPQVSGGRAAALGSGTATSPQPVGGVRNAEVPLAGMFTPRSQAIASLPSPQERFGLRGADGRMRGEESTVAPQHHFRLDTPLAAALQQRQMMLSPSPASVAGAGGAATPQSSLRPLQKLFASHNAIS